jgi:hypothetical protein
LEEKWEQVEMEWQMLEIQKMFDVHQMQVQ